MKGKAGKVGAGRTNQASRLPPTILPMLRENWEIDIHPPSAVPPEGFLQDKPRVTLIKRRL